MRGGGCTHDLQNGDIVRSANIAFAEWRPFLVSLVIAGLGGAVVAALLSYLLARTLCHPSEPRLSARRARQGGA